MRAREASPRSTEGQKRRKNLTLRNLDMIEYAQLLITLTNSLIITTQSADTLRHMQILHSETRCKIPKRQDTRQYYSTGLRHDTIQNMARDKTLR